MALLRLKGRGKEGQREGPHDRSMALDCQWIPLSFSALHLLLVCMLAELNWKPVGGQPG